MGANFSSFAAQRHITKILFRSQWIKCICYVVCVIGPFQWKLLTWSHDCFSFYFLLTMNFSDKFHKFNSIPIRTIYFVKSTFWKFIFPFVHQSNWHTNNNANSFSSRRGGLVALLHFYFCFQLTRLIKAPTEQNRREVNSMSTE